MRLKLLVQGLKLIETFHQLADTLNLRNQVSNMHIYIYIHNEFNLFLKSLLIDFFIVNFIDHQSQQSSKIKPRDDWNDH